MTIAITKNIELSEFLLIIPIKNPDIDKAEIRVFKFIFQLVHQLYALLAVGIFERIFLKHFQKFLFIFCMQFPNFFDSLSGPKSSFLKRRSLIISNSSHQETVFKVHNFLLLALRVNPVKASPSAIKILFIQSERSSEKPGPRHAGGKV